MWQMASGFGYPRSNMLRGRMRFFYTYLQLKVHNCERDLLQLQQQ